MANKGYAILSRDVTQKPWFNDPNTLKLYVFLLVNAAFSDMEREYCTVHKGEYMTSVSTLSKLTGLTIRQTRTALSHLKKTNDITIAANTKFSIIKLNSTAFEPSGSGSADTLVDKQRDNPTDNRSSKEKEECKNKMEKEEGAALPPPLPSFDFSSLSENSAPISERDALTAVYGEATVALYEDKFRKWTTKKNAANVSMYKTIAKWLAQDIRTEIGAPTAAASDNSPKKPRSSGSPDIDKLMENIMRRYAKRTFLDNQHK